MLGVRKSVVKADVFGGRSTVRCAACSEDKTDMKLRNLLAESILLVVQQCGHSADTRIVICLGDCFL